MIRMTGSMDPQTLLFEEKLRARALILSLFLFPFIVNVGYLARFAIDPFALVKETQPLFQILGRGLMLMFYFRTPQNRHSASSLPNVPITHD
jgi:hypothetical protein